MFTCSGFSTLPLRVGVGVLLSSVFGDNNSLVLLRYTIELSYISKDTFADMKAIFGLLKARGSIKAVL